VATNMPSSLQPYGLNVPMWFCPVRPSQFTAADTWSQQNLGHGLNSIADMQAYFQVGYPGFCRIDHAWWVPRISSGTTYFPATNTGTARLPDGWPRKTTDNCASVNPIISDKNCANEWNTNVNGIMNTIINGGHFSMASTCPSTQPMPMVIRRSFPSPKCSGNGMATGPHSIEATNPIK